MNTYDTGHITRLLFLSFIVMSLVIGIHLLVTKDSSITLIDLIVIILSYNIIFMTGDMLVQFYQCMIEIKSTNNSCNVNNAVGYEAGPKTSFEVTVTTLAFIIHLIIFVILNVLDSTQFYHSMQKFNALTCTHWIFFSWMFSKIINFVKQSELNTCTIDWMQGLDYGTGMAYSYYYGYLKLILPSPGTLTKGLREKIENTEDKHNITIAVHKLLILIPSSSYVPPDLKDASYQWMESAIDLEVDIRDRAGTKRRSYHNNIYKIYKNGKHSNCAPLYVVAEGATPLLTFFEVQKHSHRETDIYKKYHVHIVKKFHETLKELLNNDPECSDLCELIYYDDYDENGIKVNIAKIILERLSNIPDLN
ncbi:transmembrane protein sting [Andrena cerasifolii]|uniref:transmembrane protein sting n=1 Tax=Andrena cerasifolii TaxID=2819439 RepID=UPI004037D38F